jgi:hypothetical protein
MNCDQGEENRLLQESDPDFKKREDSVGGARPREEPEKLRAGVMTDKVVRLCKCGKPTLSPSCPFCASCMNKRSRLSNAGGKKEKARPVSLPSPGRSKKKSDRSVELTPEQKSSSLTSDQANKLDDHESTIVIKFGEYSSVLEAVKNLAREEMRPIDLEIIYLLKKGVKGFF